MKQKQPATHKILIRSYLVFAALLCVTSPKLFAILTPEIRAVLADIKRKTPAQKIASMPLEAQKNGGCTQLKKYIYKPDDPTHKLFKIAYENFAIERKGIIHIGAHMAEELPLYLAFGAQNILWIEANPKLKTALKKRLAHHKGSKCLFFAASNEESEANFCFTPQAPTCSSLLSPARIVERIPHMRQQERIRVQQKRLDDVMRAENILHNYNVMLIDVQGAELKALQGSTETLRHIDALILEVAWCASYAGGARLHELDDFLRAHNFIRMETLIDTRLIDGDALYVKQAVIDRYNPLFDRQI